MQRTLMIMGLLRATSAFPGVMPESYANHASNATKSISTQLSTYTSTSTTIDSTTSPCAESTGSSTAQGSSSTSIGSLYPYPTGGMPIHTSQGPSIWSYPNPYPTAGSSSSSSLSATTSATSAPYTTEIATIPVIKTITKHVPCSSEVSTNGQTWFSTYLTASYYTTSYMTTTTITAPQPTSASATWYGVEPTPSSYPWQTQPQCPPQATVTETVTKYILLPSPVPESYKSYTTKTLTLTLEEDHTTTLTISYPLPTVSATTSSSVQSLPPYPIQSSSASGQALCSTCGYSHGTGNPTAPATKSALPTGYSPSSSSTAWSGSTGAPRYY